MQNDICCLQPKDRETKSDVRLRHNIFPGILQNIWQKLLKIVLANPQEIQVKQKLDRYGNQYWYVYDPVTGKSFASGSDADISMWIEQIYRQSNYGKIDNRW